MAFPSASTLGEALRQTRDQAGLIKGASANLRARSAAGPIGAREAIAFLDLLRGLRAELAATAARPGMDTFATEQLGRSVAADFTAMLDAMDATITWLASALPKNAQGYLLVEQMDAAGTRTERTFSTTETTGLRTRLDALIATIE